MRVAREHGDISHARLGAKHIYLLNHPEYIKDVLVTNNRRFIGLAFEAGKSVTGEGLLSAQGEAHRRQRRLVQPAFHRDRLPSYGAAMVSYALRWRERQRDSVSLDIRAEMMRLTLGVVGETMFGAEAAEYSAAEEVRELIDSAMGLFGPVTFLFARLLERLPLPQVRRFHNARDRLDARIYRMIQERRQRGDDRGDLLSMLLLAQDEEGDGGRLTDRQLRDEIITIFLAGHETTATALTWVWYLLSQHPQVERRPHAELDSVLGDRPPAPDDLPRLPYTGYVFAEALRLYPSVAMIFRRVLADHEVGDYVLPAGAIVIMSQYVMHRDPRYYAEPEAFNPDRWVPEVRSARPRFAYFPFGGGPRVCIGEGFASMEGVLILAALAQRWRPRLAAGQTVEPDTLAGLRPRGGLRMHLERRGAPRTKEPELPHLR